jgi:hypothetical protein
VTSVSDLRAAVSRADDVLGNRDACNLSEEAALALSALYKAAKALVSADEPRERWVDAEGVTRLPRAMREELRVCDGAHIWFLRGPERWEAWNESELSELFGGESVDENASDEYALQIVPVRGLDYAAIEPHISRDVEFVGIRGTITEHKATSSCATPTENTLKTCWCFRCLDEPSMGPFNSAMRRMILCPQCGNKRCPRATSHDNACSGSNEPGQDGSEK